MRNLHEVPKVEMWEVRKSIRLEYRGTRFVSAERAERAGILSDLPWYYRSSGKRHKEAKI